MVGSSFMCLRIAANPIASIKAIKPTGLRSIFSPAVIVPSHGRITRFPELFTLEHDWRWSGAHYQKTALAWLENFDTNGAAIAPISAAVYGAEADLWRPRRCLVFLATAGLFGRWNGKEWGVNHYRLRPA